MAENELKKSNDDEISLIDLFVILLKYRWLIAVFAVLGLVVSIGYYVMRAGKSESAGLPPNPLELCEGRMPVLMNPRIGRSSADRFPTWFDSRELFNAALKEVGLDNLTFESFTIRYQNDSADIVLKPSSVDGEFVKRFFAVLLRNAESLASDYYVQYAADVISYFESLREQGKDYSAQDYIRYQWAGDFLSGSDTVLKAPYPPFVFTYPAAASDSGRSASPRVVSLVIFFASLFFAVFLAFVLNAFKNISADDEAMVKIRGALRKKQKGGI
jgi:hypothetical protein